MAKTTDFPSDLRHFAGVMNTLSGHYYDYDIFRDFVDYTTACLLWHGDAKLAQELQTRYRDDYPRFKDLFVALLNTMAEQTIDGGWYDALGSLYEVIASRNKCSWLGQFFTPPSLCDMMAQFQAQDVREDAKTANDPACGSGRTLLALNAVRPGLYYIAQDLDPICTKMTAINMALHGAKGQSVNGSSLDPDDFQFGYEVNPRLYTMQGIPHLLPITKDASYAHQMWQRQLEHINAPKEPEKLPAKIPEVQKLAGLPATQLTIF
jgi:type I restriction enzyme M protein